MKQKTAQQGFLRGAAILTAGVFLVKLLGALFKIPLNWIIGEDGMGYYTTAYSFYAPVYSLAELTLALQGFWQQNPPQNQEK